MGNKNERKVPKIDWVNLTCFYSQILWVSGHYYAACRASKWNDNTDSLFKSGQSFHYMLRRLASIGVCRPLLRTFYETVGVSVVFYAVICWGGRCSERHKKRLNRLIKRASSVCGRPLDTMKLLGARKALAKLSTIMDNPSHLLLQTLWA